LQIKPGKPIEMPEWRSSGVNMRVRVERTDLDDKVMSRLAATSRALEESGKKDRVLVGTLPR